MNHFRKVVIAVVGLVSTHALLLHPSIKCLPVNISAGYIFPPKMIKLKINLTIGNFRISLGLICMAPYTVFS